ncbi:hypothetical protein EOL72_03120 [Candidatus Falkowbacteria bacterium]|nr:hypothetical protein [Patescibacteria group bacterium]NCU43311.1 hypothetical protein [Candidatus Falkowbacteria bacterium]
MKNRFLLLIIPLFFILSACSWGDSNKEEPREDNIKQNQELDVVEALSQASVTPEQINSEDTLFSYEYPDLGIKLSYPNTCYFNKGMIDCGNFTLSVWPLEMPVASEPTKEFTADGYTEIKQGFLNGDNNYALMAWYQGEDDEEIEAAIKEIAATLTFTH